MMKLTGQVRTYIKRLTKKRAKSRDEGLADVFEQVNIRWSLSILLTANEKLPPARRHEIVLVMISAGLIPGATPEDAKPENYDKLIKKLNSKLTHLS